MPPEIEAASGTLLPPEIEAASRTLLPPETAPGALVTADEIRMTADERITYRDLAIGDLAHENALLRERVASLAHALAIARDLARAALDVAHGLTQQVEAGRPAHEAAEAAARGWREEALLAAGVDDVDALTEEA
jgi:hypothetical protein